MTLRDLLLKTADAALDLQESDGSFPAGHNGPWHNVETPVRNTAHWTMTLAKALELTGSERYWNALEKAGEFLFSDARRPDGHSFKIFEGTAMYGGSNGLVGQAWVFEALLALYSALDDKRYIELAVVRALSQPWDDTLQVWRTLSVDGKDMGIQWSLNQQIWFAALSKQLANLANNETLHARVLAFSDRLPRVTNFWNGFIRMRMHEMYFLSRPNFFAKLMRSRIRNHKKLGPRSQGYIAYSYYPLSLLHKEAPELSVWADQQFLKHFRSSLQFIDDMVFSFELKSNPYAYTYHPTGFEMAFILESFTKVFTSKHTISSWISKQISQHYDFDSNLMCKNTVDPNTLAARFYEAVRIEDIDSELFICKPPQVSASQK